MPVRRCDRPDCSRPASVSLSYRYADRSVWIGELLPDHDVQHGLCGGHADRLQIPRGWELVDLRSALPTLPDSRTASVA